MNRLIPSWATLLLVFGGAAVRADVVVLSFGVSSTYPSGNLFREMGPPQIPGPSHGPSATTAWSVGIDFGTLATLPPSLAVNFPDRSPVTLARVRAQDRGPGAFLWTGRGGDCSGLFSAAANGWFKGTLSCLNGSYGIEGDSGGVHLARYEHIGEAPPDDPSPNDLPLAAPRGCPELEGEGDQVIDILVLYNEAVRANLDPGGGHVNTDLFMRYAVDQTQLALDNSTESTTPQRPVIATVNFVGAAKVTRADSGNLVADLLYLGSNNEPMDLRDAFGADVVLYVVINGGTQFLGLANLAGYPPFPPPGECYAPFAQAALIKSKAVNPGDYVFAHEFAHLFGANHDRGSITQPNPWEVEAWAYGWWENDPETNAGKRTLMAQDVAACGQSGSPCTRILNYSNSLIELDWFETGQVDTAENSRVIDEFAEITAQYKASLTRLFADGFE